MRRFSIVFAIAGILFGCRPIDSRLCAPCEIDVCGPGLSCLHGLCVPPEAPSACGSRLVCGDGPPCSDGYECFEGQCRTPLAVEAGWNHANALWPSGRVSEWGYFDVDDDGVSALTSTVVSIANLTDVEEISAGINVSCARSKDGTVRCWGRNEQGQVGNPEVGDFDTTDAPELVPLPAPAKRLFSAEHRSCVILEDDRLYCWGDSGRGCVNGSSSTADVYAPIEVLPSIDTSAIGLGSMHTVWTSNGRAYGLGDDGAGQLGVGRACAPTDLGFDDVTGIAAGSEHTCVVQRERQVTCFGNPRAGVRGFEHSRRIEKIFAGRYLTCIIDEAAAASCWGEDNGGVMGSPDFYQRLGGPLAPVLLPLLQGATHIALNEGFGCFVDDRRGTFCWGAPSGGFGDGAPDKVEPRRLHEGPHLALTVGTLHACAKDVEGRVWCWGTNSKGQLGQGWRSRAEAPSEVPDLIAAAIGAGAEYTCAIDDAGEGWCWGDIAMAGTGPSPARVPELPHVQALAAGWYTACFLTMLGEVYCLGVNDAGQANPRSAATSLTTASRVDVPLGAVEVAVGSATSCARWPDDTIRCWGRMGVDSIPSAFGRPEGVVVPGVAAIDVGLTAIVVLLEDGTLLAGGENMGRLGTGGGRPELLAPLVVVEAVALVDIYGATICATERSGRVLCWGEVATYPWSSNPAPIETVPLSRTAVAGYKSACVLSRAGEPWCWGRGPDTIVGAEFARRYEPARVLGMHGRGPID